LSFRVKRGICYLPPDRSNSCPATTLPFVIPSETRNLLPAIGQKQSPQPRPSLLSFRVKRGICFLPDAPSLAPFKPWDLSNSTTARNAENVDEGPNPTAIHQSFMKSPQHRANILDPDMDSAGIGIAERNGQLFAVEDFCKAK
jgi:hypothetical protein